MVAQGRHRLPGRVRGSSLDAARATRRALLFPRTSPSGAQGAALRTFKCAAGARGGELHPRGKPPGARLSPAASTAFSAQPGANTADFIGEVHRRADGRTPVLAFWALTTSAGTNQPAPVRERGSTGMEFTNLRSLFRARDHEQRAVIAMRRTIRAPASRPATAPEHAFLGLPVVVGRRHTARHGQPASGCPNRLPTCSRSSPLRDDHPKRAGQERGAGKPHGRPPWSRPLHLGWDIRHETIFTTYRRGTSPGTTRAWRRRPRALARTRPRTTAPTGRHFSAHRRWDAAHRGASIAVAGPRAVGAWVLRRGPWWSRTRRRPVRAPLAASLNDRKTRRPTCPVSESRPARAETRKASASSSAVSPDFNNLPAIGNASTCSSGPR